MEKMNKQGIVFVKNVIYAVGAQIVSLSASLAISFIATKYIKVENFAYWQLFLFYVTYINISRLGLIDGLYLRLGGKDYKELEHGKLSMEWLIFVIFQLIISLIIFTFVIFSDMEGDRKFVYCSCCICIVLINSNNYFSYILQAVNLTKRYSVSIIIQNVFWFVALFIIIFFRIYSYKVIVIMYILGHVFAGIYLSKYVKDIWKVKIHPIREVFVDIKDNVSCGIMLMISLYAGNLIIGSVRIIIDNAWGVEIFGYFSFALTLSHFILTFISQISLVMFPALKRVESHKQVEVYNWVRKLLSIILPIVLVGYLPVCLIVYYWLPDYIPSLDYFLYLLPICTFDGKMQILCSTYFKVLRKEKLLMHINLLTMFLSASVAWVCSYIFNDIYLLTICLLFIIALRSITSEYILAYIMKKNITKTIIIECALVFIYFIFNTFLNINVASLLYLLVYFAYALANRKFIKDLLRKTIKDIK